MLVFPTPVGVFPGDSDTERGGFRLPHARGGVSIQGKEGAFRLRSSPRPWGCFQQALEQLVDRLVFPTPVGVFLDWPVDLIPSDSLPHARGGVSYSRHFVEPCPKSSPRPWGCFQPQQDPFQELPVFPTPVGVFLQPRLSPVPSGSLPHARGGVSKRYMLVAQDDPSSPRPWGCFQPAARHNRWCQVFPTPVGVFPPHHPDHSGRQRLPHARGGVSVRAFPRSRVTASSPRPWGCF